MYDGPHGILEAPDFALKDGVVEKLHKLMDPEEFDRRSEPSHCDIEKVRNILFQSTIFDYFGVTENSNAYSTMFTKMVFGDASLAGAGPASGAAACAP